jgi:alginate O-acetyltransferase complex protein AlgI
MLFNSLHFLIFFLITTFLYFSIPYNKRWILLLAGSCYFYMAFVPIYILILGFTITIDYFAGRLIENEEGKKRKLFLICSIIANIGVLAIFKYFNFLNHNFSFLLHGFGLSNPIPFLSIILPIGLSFHTFQAMSYTIEVFRGNQKAERHFGIYALYVMFFPQLVAGPIERPQNLLHQFYEKHLFTSQNFQSGLMQIAFGFFKKVVIADRLAMAVDYSYQNYSSQSGFSLAIASILYSFQIYCDFSGYSDIAIGSARIMGFKLMTNFNAPYFSKSISEFWKRWHISLSTWFRDYLYISLGGNRTGKTRTYFNLLIVFLLSGLWHGANWTFVIWGTLHGLFVMIEKSLTILKNKVKIKWNGKVVRYSQMIFTFFLVTIAWVFFRAENYSKALIILNKIFHCSVLNTIDLKLNSLELVFSFLLMILLIIKEKKIFKLNIQNRYTFITLIILISLGCYFFGVFNNKQFIYFQF